MKPAFLLTLALGLILASGCNSVTARIEPGQSAVEYERFFVRSNLNDSHALDQHIAAALAARGHTVESGPLTMQPANTEVTVTYEDRWAWDFGDHLVYLNISMRESRSGRQIGTTVYRSRFKMGRNAPDIATRIVNEMLDAQAGSSR